MQAIHIQPEMQAVKNAFNIKPNIFEIKWHNKLTGIIIKQYLAMQDIRLNCNCLICFFIRIKFSKLMLPIDKKNETTTELIPISGVKIIILANRTMEPIM